MTVLVFVSSATAYFFSGLICYLASANQQNQYSSATSKLLFKTSGNLWITALWPFWIAKEIHGNQAALESFEVKPVSYLEADRQQTKR